MGGGRGLPRSVAAVISSSSSSIRPQCSVPPAEGPGPSPPAAGCPAPAFGRCLETEGAQS